MTTLATQLREAAIRARAGCVYLPQLAALLDQAATALEGGRPQRPPCPPGCRTLTGRVNHAHCRACREEHAQKEEQR